MLTDTLFRKPRTTGIQVLQRRGDAGARELTTRRITLDAGGSAEFHLDDEETVVVLQQGRGTFAVGPERWTVGRDSVFTERATALYLPPGASLAIRADAPLEAVLFSTPAPAGGRAALTTPDRVTPAARGRGHYAREVHNLFVDDPHARRLMVGETFNPPGNWSSYPPHKDRKSVV